MRILFLVQHLVGGGAERQVRLLAEGLARRNHDTSILSINAPPPRYRAPENVRVLSAGKRNAWDIVLPALRLVRRLRRERPQILYAHLPAANCAAALLRPLARGARVIFGVRASNMELGHYGSVAAFPYRLERLLSRVADLIIANSHAGRHHLVGRGYPADRVLVIANGFDVVRFAPNPAVRARARTALGIGAEAPVVGFVGRLDPMKNIPMFLAAVRSAAVGLPELRAAVFGDGPAQTADGLKKLAKRLGIGDRVAWFGDRNNMAELMPALDLLCLSSSFGEGCPNSVGEAMASGVPCVVTDVGDAALLVGETGIVVAPQDTQAMADAIARLLSLPAEERIRLGAQARARIATQFGVEALVERTEEVLSSLLGEPADRGK